MQVPLAFEQAFMKLDMLGGYYNPFYEILTMYSGTQKHIS
jgi:hypothetical protein